jgi:hypothetical protein
MAPSNSTEFLDYNEGIKLGCWGLLSFSIVGAISAGFFTNESSINLKHFLN